MIETPAIKEMGFVSAIWSKSEWKPKDKVAEGFYDPIDIMENCNIPAMVFFGDLDKNVDPLQGFQAYRAAFTKAGNPNFIVKMIHGSDHNIIISETGCVMERMARTSQGWSNYDPEYLQMMQDWLAELSNVKPTIDLLMRYSEQSSFTDPGEYAYLFDDIPESIPEICNLIKKQLIHPQEASEIRDLLPEGREPEDGDFPGVSEMLRILLQRDSSGLTMNRRIEDRLIVACYHHALLLVSILRHRNIPVRLRAGFAKYYEKETNLRFGHVICEVWDERRQKWILVDPDRNIIDVDPSRFEFPSEAWQNFYGSDYRSVRYVSSNGEGLQALLHALLLDHSFVISLERSYWHTPSAIYAKNFKLEDLDQDELQTINQISDYIYEPDLNINKLQAIYDDHPFIHPCDRSIMGYYEKIEDQVDEQNIE